jgi:putative transposase
VKLRDRGAGEGGERIHFTSAILPRWGREAWMRCCRSFTCAVVSMGDFGEALAALLGSDARTCRRRLSRGCGASGKPTTHAGTK